MALTELTTDSPLDITGATDDVSGYVRLRRQTGVENTLPTEIGVTAHIAEEQIERTIRQVPIQIEGLTDDKIANAEMGRTTIQLTVDTALSARCLRKISGCLSMFPDWKRERTTCRFRFISTMRRNLPVRLRRRRSRWSFEISRLVMQPV